MTLMEEVEEYFSTLKNNALSSFNEIDKSGRIEKNEWKIPIGLMEVNVFKGEIFEKAGVSYSSIKTKIPRTGQETDVRVLEILTYMTNPKVPRFGISLRYLSNGGDRFMGSCDISPSIIFEEDLKHFEEKMRNLSQKHGKNYEELRELLFKTFTSKYSGEMRLGGKGVAFDVKADDFGFFKDCGETFLSTVLEIVKKRKDEAYSEADKDKQLYDRGKWVEFNLMEDEGFIIGIKLGIPPEAMNYQTLPPLAKFYP